MVDIIPEIRRERQPSFRERLLGGLGNLSEQTATQIPQMLMQRRGEKLENEAIQRITGHDVKGLSPELKKSFFEKFLGTQGAKQTEKRNALASGLETIQRMRGLISSAGPSNFVQGLFGGETTQKRAELEALGRSLIPLVAAGVPIRNQREFEEYRKVITNPNARQAELQGALDGLESLFEQSLSHSEMGQEKASFSEKREKMKFNPSNPEHKAKATQLYKTYKDKEKVRQALSKEFAF